MAHRLANQFAREAAQRDRERRWPVRELDAFSQSGLWPINVSKAFGGPEFSDAPLSKVIQIISAADPFEARYGADKSEPDVQFFKEQLRKWFFDGMITLRIDPRAKGFHATVRSAVLAREVIAPTLETVGKVVPLADEPVRIRPADRHARLSDYAQGRLTPPADIRPYPFEVEFFAPGGAGAEERIGSLFVAVHEVLRHYRAMISHAQNI